MSEWIEWDGGECPVAPDVMVCIKFRDGNDFFADDKRALGAVDWTPNWHHSGGDSDIIAYRVIGAADD